jgi:subtilisin-like proprotein convertase family protein
MVTSIHRINGVYENEFAVSLQIISRNDTLIFLDKDTDPFENGNGGAMLGQNQTTCDARVGPANYDMGHVFSTGGGGVAGLGVICNHLSKANGVTGRNEPIGDKFDIDYVAHEMGHQFSGNHTQNNSCNRADDTAVEPGSGSTIMGYAGICAPDVQPNSDDYFHGINVEEVITFITTGQGDRCPAKTQLDNVAPVVEAGPDVRVPRGTPFYLKAQGSDPNEDKITYCWEQMDAQEGTMPPVSTSTQGPMFRSIEPDSSNTRFFPRNPTSGSQWERLPGVGRSMKFRVTARDNNPVGGGISWDDMTVNVSPIAGPFRVTYPNSLVFWRYGEIRQITWEVGNTDQPPFNCTHINILLSNNGGKTYDMTIAKEVPNTGSYCFVIPDTFSNSLTNARIKIEPTSGIYYDYSDNSFQIRPSLKATFNLCGIESTANVCLPDPYTTSLQIGSVSGFKEPVDFTATGLPTGGRAEFSPNPALPGQTVNVRIYLPDTMSKRTLTIGIKGKSGTDSVSLNTRLTAIPNNYAALAALSPELGAAGLPQANVLRWNRIASAFSYEVQVSTSPLFEPGSIVFSKGGLTTDSVKTPLLPRSTVYYWRLRAQNECGDGPWAPMSAYSTVAETCRVFAANDVPRIIPTQSASTITSVITLNAEGIISDINVKKLEGNHSFFKDLKTTLTGPGGQSAVLFSGVCGNYNGKFNLLFDDEANAKLSCPPNVLVSVHQPAEPFSIFKQTNPKGTWTLKIEETTGSSGGQLAGFELEVCQSSVVSSPFVVVNNPLKLKSGTNASVTQGLLEVQDADNSAAQLTYTLISLPASGELRYSNGNPLSIGSQFTQEDINAGRIFYFDNNGTAASFRFVVTDGQGGFVAGTFRIELESVLVTDVGAFCLFMFCLYFNLVIQVVWVQCDQPLSHDLLTELVDPVGRSVRSALLLQGTKAVSFDVAALPAGVYWVRGGAQTKKLVVWHP